MTGENVRIGSKLFKMPTYDLYSRSPKFVLVYRNDIINTEVKYSLRRQIIRSVVVGTSLKIM
jgi:hypothetical protein